jgi:type I restriction enzyme M protein
MLDTDTKRKIDNARSILVGKVPDPKAQVEQITTALIYKFMDDMDKEAEELGGESRYFSNEYELYSWAKLLDKRLSGQGRLDLYVQALEKMAKNPHIPQLFRDIFKNAFLPYRDTETLHLFLKEINNFTYDHSENLGNAFEYLLSVLGSQGDAGQFRTPRHIIDFIVEVVDPKKNETILDPACGTAGFLISSYKHIRKHNSLNFDPQKEKSNARIVTGATATETILQDKAVYRGDNLTPENKKNIAKNIAGYDISPDMVKLSKVNMYLHGFQDPKISEYDTLSSEERWGETFDVILANPPFMSPKGGIRPHSKFSTSAKRSEVLFVDYIMDHINIKGRAGIIVPEGIIFKTDKAYKKLRKKLVEDGLYAVVSLPSGVFNPYSGVKTSILLFDNRLAKASDEILFVKIENDGFDLGAQRRKIDKNDLPRAIEILEDWKRNQKIVEGKTLTHAVKKMTIAGSGDYNLSGERYKQSKAQASLQWPMVELGEICEVISGQSPEGKFYNEQKKGVPFYQGKTEFQNLYIGPPKKWTSSVTKLSLPNDILISVRAPVGPVNLCNLECCIGRGLAAIRPKQNNNVLSRYVFYFLRNMEEKIKGNTGATFASINRKDIQSIEIPLPPLEVQKEIVEEIEEYQKIIDGARQVVENYKPHIPIDPSWPMVKLEEACSFEYGRSMPEKNRKEGKFPVVGSNGVVGTHNNFLVKGPAIIVGRKGSAGEVNWVDQDCFPIDTTYFVQNKKTDSINFRFLYYTLLEMDLQSLRGGGAVPGLNRNDAYRKEIYLPPLETQKKVSDQIEEEQKLVNANKELIRIFEEKIKETINKVWGADHE